MPAPKNASIPDGLLLSFNSNKRNADESNSSNSVLNADRLAHLDSTVLMREGYLNLTIANQIIASPTLIEKLGLKKLCKVCSGNSNNALWILTNPVYKNQLDAGCLRILSETNQGIAKQIVTSEEFKGKLDAFALQDICSTYPELAIDILSKREFRDKLSINNLRWICALSTKAGIYILKDSELKNKFQSNDLVSICDNSHKYILCIANDESLSCKLSSNQFDTILFARPNKIKIFLKSSQLRQKVLGRTILRNAEIFPVLATFILEDDSLKQTYASILTDLEKILDTHKRKNEKKKPSPR